MQFRDFELEQRIVPASYTPQQIAHAYTLDKLGALGDQGAHETIAIVDYSLDPNLASDLHTFDQKYNLPDPPSLKQAFPSGTPPVDANWSVEIALDVEWAHAMAPKANILYVGSSGPDVSLFGAVQYAAKQPGVVAVSMSWGTPEFSGESFNDLLYFGQPGGKHGNVAYVAASGDTGAQSSYPAASPKVLSVGGTTLLLNGSSYGSESAWQGVGYGGGGGPSTADRPGKSPILSWSADPAHGFPVYDSAYTPRPGWLTVGGTSAGSPQVAALIAITDEARAKAHRSALSVAQIDGYLASLKIEVYDGPHAPIHDITLGGTGPDPVSHKAYAAEIGYDYATGYGSPVAARLVPTLVKLPSVVEQGIRSGHSVAPPVTVQPLHEIKA